MWGTEKVYLGEGGNGTRKCAKIRVQEEELRMSVKEGRPRCRTKGGKKK